MTGSEIAKAGFANEQEVADKFNNWKADRDARRWLELMMYDLDEIVSVKAEKIGQKGYKSDINVIINVRIVKKGHHNIHLTSVENIQVKLVSTSTGYNQVEKKKAYNYVNMWHIPDDIKVLLEFFDGERKPISDTRDARRMFADEFTQDEQDRLLEFFQKNIVMIVSDVIRGRGRFAAEWTLVVNKYDGYKWVLLSINEAIGIYLGDCKASITSKGNIRLGNITLQRKGGDKGASSADMLQFKADPLILFMEDTLHNTSDGS